jgi:hypothetical protein
LGRKGTRKALVPTPEYLPEKSDLIAEYLLCAVNISIRDQILFKYLNCLHKTL